MSIVNDLTTEQLATVLHKPNRRSKKRYLKDLGGAGNASELDRVLDIARKSEAAVAEAERMAEQRRQATSTIELGVLGDIAEVIADIRLTLQEADLTQDEVASRCGWPPSLLSAYLNGTKSPGLSNLIKLASALDCKWRLVRRADTIPQA